MKKSKKSKKIQTSSHLNPSRYPTYFNGDRAYVGDLVRYHNLIDVARRFDHDEDKEVFLLAGIAEELTGTTIEDDDPNVCIDSVEWLADIRNNKNSHIINLNYLVKIQGE